VPVRFRPEVLKKDGFGHPFYFYLNKIYFMFFVDVLFSQSRNYIYVGMTDNLERRVGYHNDGYNKTTKPYRPFQVLLTEKFATRMEARAREKYLKSGVGKEFLKTLLNHSR
jgi:putative endonuclease